MNEESLRDLLGKVRNNETTPEDAVRLLKQGPFKVSSSSEATPDHHRRLRHGLCEVIYGAGKTVEQTKAIARELAEAGNPVLITRLDEAKKFALRDAFPGSRAGRSTGTLLLNPPAPIAPAVNQPHVAIVSAGTSDLFVAEEATETCVATQTPYRIITDVGIAGLHRILQRIDDLEAASALVVIAGMEGALPSVVGGLVGKPIFAVPTSVGYGANLGGITALLAMLNSCSPGIAVVNIDNGFSAGYAACRVVSEINRKRESADRR